MNQDMITDALSIGDYHALDRLSPSGIGSLLRSPAHYQADRQAWATRTPSKALRIGSAVHLLVLEPHLVASHLPVAPDVNRRTKAGREEYAAWEASLLPDAIRLDPLERQTAELAAKAVLENAGIQKAGILEGRVENSILFEEDGVPCKARPDVISDRGFLVDLKTSQDASDFVRSVANYGYHRQDAWLRLAAHKAALEVKGTIFVVVETVRPYGVRTVMLDETSVLQGERENMRAVQLYKRCLEEGEWPCYPAGLDTISLPLWRIDQD